MQDAIVVDGLSKRFRRHGTQPARTLKDLLLGRNMRRSEYFWGLRDVSFSVAQGRTVGFIGPNGAGKSTLMRLVGGVGLPNSGKVRTVGRIGALLDLGSGLHHDLTGRENIFVGGIIAGMTRAEVARRFDAIVDFAELEAFIDSPLRTYSTGMQMRLAFAVAAHIDPQILLIDEVLAVGDLAFKQKCLERIKKFKAQGCTIVLVSHESSQVRQLCDEVIWLRNGTVNAHGPTELVLNQYITEMQDETRRRTPTQAPTMRLPMGTELRLNQNRFGSLETQIEAVQLLSRRGYEVIEIDSGDALQVVIAYNALQAVEAPIASVSISRPDGSICYDTNTAMAGQTLPTGAGPGQTVLQIERLDLAGGEYFVNVGLHERNWAYTYDYHWHTYPLRIVGGPGGEGVLCPPQQWSLEARREVQLSAEVAGQ